MEQARQAVLRVSQGWVAPARREAAVTPGGGAARGHQAGARRHGSRSGRSPDHGLVSLDPRLSPQAGRGPHRRLARGMVPDDAYVDSEDVDARLNAARCQQVDLCIDELPWQQRAAIGVHAGNSRRGACSAIRACRRKRSMPPTDARAALLPALRRRAAGRWPCDTPIAKALVRVGRPLHNDFRREVAPGKTEPAELHRLAGRGFCCRPIAAFRQVFEEAPGRMPRSLFSSQDHSVRGARDLRDASASPCARPGGPFMDARQGPQFRFARHFRRVFGVSNGWYYRFAIRSDPGHAAGSVHHEHQRPGRHRPDLRRPAITIKDPNFQGGQTTEIDVTVLKSAAKEYALGLDDSGTFSMAGNWKAGDAAQKVLVAARSDKKSRAFRVTFADGSKFEFLGRSRNTSGKASWTTSCPPRSTCASPAPSR